MRKNNSRFNPIALLKKSITGFLKKDQRVITKEEKKSTARSQKWLKETI